jgi:type IV fimbrial biogenesis protein FimT
MTSSATFPALVARRRTAGLTLIELLIGVVMAGILLVQAMPEFSSWLARQRLAGQAGTLGTAMSYAKAEAITRGVRVTLCPSAAPTASSPACSSSAWTDGWLVFVDNTQRAGNTAGVLDAEDTVLRIGERLAGGTATADTAVSSWVAFTPDGLSVLGPDRASNGAIRLCLNRQSRSVTLSNVGAITTSSGTC